MTALNTDTQIPASINTLEATVAWGAMALATMHPNKRVLETELQNEYVAQYGIFKAADGTTRLFVRMSFQLDPAYLSDNTKKLWGHVQEFNDTAIPQGFLS